ncbi:MAG: hypothetical protein IKY79_00095 [Bacteroidales bacterium]|nr:hypothetical protein [Bacteroidales bacterium]
MNNSPEEIEKLLKRFYAASLSPDEMHSLYTYFLHTNPLPDRFKNDAPLVQAFAIRYFCQKERGALDSKIDQWYENEKTATRSAKIISLSRTAMKRIVAVAACVAAVVVGLWQLRINSVLIPNTPEALQPSPTILVAQTTDKPATITDNEIKNKPTTEQNTMPTTATPQPDIIATAPIEQEHIPVLLTEAETQIEIEQNFVADTAYMIADAEPIYNNLEMYCSTRCSSNEVFISFDKGMGKKIMI